MQWCHISNPAQLQQFRFGIGPSVVSIPGRIGLAVAPQIDGDSPTIPSQMFKLVGPVPGIAGKRMNE
jgi:hypothetical protein